MNMANIYRRKRLVPTFSAPKHEQLWIAHIKMLEKHKLHEVREYEEGFQQVAFK